MIPQLILLIILINSISSQLSETSIPCSNEILQNQQWPEPPTLNQKRTLNPTVPQPEILPKTQCKKRCFTIGMNKNQATPKKCFPTHQRYFKPCKASNQGYQPGNGGYNAGNFPHQGYQNSDRSYQQGYQGNNIPYVNPPNGYQTSSSSNGASYQTSFSTSGYDYAATTQAGETMMVGSYKDYNDVSPVPSSNDCIGDKCYFFSDGPLTEKEAKDFCTYSSASLASVSDQNELDNINQQFKYLGYSNCWIAAWNGTSNDQSCIAMSYGDNAAVMNMDCWEEIMALCEVVSQT